MIALLTTVVLASLIGSLHCAGMCGGLVAFYSGSDGSRGRKQLASHGAYNGGRLAAYLVLGAAAGSIGAAFDLAGSLAGVQRSAAIIAGVFMVTWGVLALLRLRGVRLFSHRADRSPVGGWIRRGLSLVGNRPPVIRALTVGLLTGLLPCGWLWAFLVTAAGTGSAIGGTLVMLVFWLGTIPILLATGLGAQVLAIPLRRHVPSVTAVLLVALGLFAILGRPPGVSAAVARKYETGADKPPGAPAAEPHDLPCCADDDVPEPSPPPEPAR